MAKPLAIIGFSAFLLMSGAARAETHAVVVGIDSYLHVKSLQGAVADARDIDGALHKRGVRDIVLLTDAEATRAHVLGAIDQMIARVQRDDLVIIAFAGHGARETWGKLHPPGVAQGAYHEVYLLPGMVRPDEQGQVEAYPSGSAGERIMGGEMAVRLQALEAKGVRTLFVADTCHAGGMTRQPFFESGVRPPATRFIPPFRFAEGQDPLALEASHLPAPIDSDRQLPALTFLAAVDQDSAAPELTIPRGSGVKRGALSYAFARVIDGAARTSAPGILTRGELMDFVQATVRTYSENAQQPYLHPKVAFEQTAIDFARDFPSTAAPQQPKEETASPVVRIFTSDPSPAAIPTLGDGSVDLRRADSQDTADLIFDPETHSVYSHSGELVAKDVKPEDLPAIAQRELAVRRLLLLARDRPREIRLQHGDKRYIQGDTVVVDGRRQDLTTTEPEYYLLFDIAGNGTVQFLYPYINANDRVKDPAILPKDKPFDHIEVRPPFGNDLLVFVVSPKPLDDVIASIRDLHEQKAALEGVRRLEASLTPEMQIGLQHIFTAPVP